MSMIDRLSRPRVLGTLLAISVAVNVFLLGSMAGRFSAKVLHPPLFGAGLEMAPGAGAPEGPHREFRRQFRERMPELRREHRALRKLHEQLATELARPEPERAALEQTLAAIREHVAKSQQALHESFVETALALPPEQRRELIDSMLSRRGPLLSPHAPLRIPLPPHARDMPPPAPPGPGPDVAD